MLGSRGSISGIQESTGFPGAYSPMRRPSSPEAPLVLDLVVGRVDGGELVVGELDELLRHAARDQLVGMILAHQQSVSPPDFFLAGRVRDPQDDVGVLLVREM